MSARKTVGERHSHRIKEDDIKGPENRRHIPRWALSAPTSPYKPKPLKSQSWAGYVAKTFSQLMLGPEVKHRDRCCLIPQNLHPRSQVIIYLELLDIIWTSYTLNSRVGGTIEMGAFPTLCVKYRTKWVIYSLHSSADCLCMISSATEPEMSAGTPVENGSVTSRSRLTH